MCAERFALVTYTWHPGKHSHYRVVHQLRSGISVAASILTHESPSPTSCHAAFHVEQPIPTQQLSFVISTLRFTFLFRRVGAGGGVKRERLSNLLETGFPRLPEINKRCVRCLGSPIPIAFFFLFFLRAEFPRSNVLPKVATVLRITTYRKLYDDGGNTLTGEIYFLFSPDCST